MKGLLTSVRFVFGKQVQNRQYVRPDFRLAIETTWNTAVQVGVEGTKSSLVVRLDRR